MILLGRQPLATAHQNNKDHAHNSMAKTLNETMIHNEKNHGDWRKHHFPTMSLVVNVRDN